MKIHQCEQRTPEWDGHRAGKFTASVAGKLLTPTGKVSTQWKGEIGRIVAEEMGLQEPEFIPPSYWMERGINMEPEARGWFQVETGLVVRQAGFIEMNQFVGFSPDGYVVVTPGLGGGEPDRIIPVELKVPKPSTHIMWLMDGGMPNGHLAQMHFQIACCGAPYGYFMSYNPRLEPLLLKVEANSYTEDMTHQILLCTDALIYAKEKFNG